MSGLETSSVRFTVVIPLYNRASHIGTALRSVRAQTFQPQEVIVVDDGSSDGGPSLVRQFHPEVRVIEQANCGPGPARNNGISNARAPWVAFLDSDDAWYPNHLEELSRIIALVPDAGLVCTGYEVVEAEIEAPVAPAALGRVREINYFDADAPAFTSSTAIRKQVADELGGFVDRLSGEDKEFWARIACFYKVGISSATTSVYRRTPDGLSEAAARRAKPVPTNIGEESVPLATVSRILDESPPELLVTVDSLRAFVNRRLASKIKRELMRGRIERARALCGFVRRPASSRIRVLVHVAFWPKWALNVASTLLGTWRGVIGARSRR